MNNTYKILLKHHEPNGDKNELWCYYGITTISSNTYSKRKAEFKEFETDDINVLKRTFLELNTLYGCENIRIVTDIEYSHDIYINENSSSSNKYDIYTENEALVIQGDDIKTSSSNEISEVKINDKTYEIRDNEIRNEIPILVTEYAKENSELLKGNDGYSPTAIVTKNGNTTTVTITDINGTTTSEIVDGADGSNGSDGYSPTTLVTKIDNGYDIVITDSNGEKSFQIYNGANGLDGLNGTDGYSPTIVEKTNEPGNYVLTITDKNNSFDTPNLRTYLEREIIKNTSDIVVYKLSPNIVSKFYNPIKDLTIDFANIINIDSYAEYNFIFTTSDVGCTLTLPPIVLWNNDSPPVLKANKIYEVSINNISSIAIICEASI